MKTNEYQSLPIEIVALAHAKNSEYGTCGDIVRASDFALTLMKF